MRPINSLGKSIYGEFLSPDQRIKTCIQPGTLISLMVILFLGGNQSGMLSSFYGTSTPTVTLVSMAEQRLVWSEVPSPANFGVNDCTFTSPTDGWAVGSKGKILHWDGKNWAPFHSPLPEDFMSLQAVDMLSPNDGWAVGFAGLMIHWNGTEWVRVPTVTDNDLKTVSLASPDLGFAGGKGSYGDSKPNEELILQWNGKQWSKVNFPPSKWQDQVGISAIQMISKDDGWATGNGQLYRWNGHSWQVYSQDSEKEALSSILFSFSALNANNIWASGWNLYKEGYAGVILHWDGIGWKEAYRTQTGGQIIDSIQMISPQQGWAWGHIPDYMANTDISFLLHWDGIRWSEFPLPTSFLITSFCAIDQNHAWLFGETTIRDKKGSVTGYDPITFFLSEVPISKVTPATPSMLTPNLTHTSSVGQIAVSTPTPFMTKTTTIQAKSTPIMEQSSSGKQDQIQTKPLVFIGVILALALVAFIFKMKQEEK